MCVCVCGIEPSSLVNEGGKSLSGKNTRKKKSDIYLILELDTHKHTYRYVHNILIYIYIYIYIYIGIWEEGGLCAVYTSVYISVYITGRGRRLVCSVHSYAPLLTAAIVYRYIYRYMPIYQYIEEGGLCAVCTPISAADGSRHRYIHRYMPIYYIRRHVFSAHSSTPPLTAPGIPICTLIYTDILAGVC
jgi:hypothetical protein